MTQATGVEAPSGKGRADENFPVGSLLIAPALRPAVHAFYAFARNADDIADSPSLSQGEKIARLNTMEDVLAGRRHSGSPTASLLRAALAERGVSSEHARDLLHAFRQDAQKNRYATWAELMEYCRYSAMPVGHFLLDLHGESREAWPHSDALCASLQVLNHLQDCATDLAELDRCYLPQDWLAAEGATLAELRADRASPALRRVLDRLLDECERLNAAARPLPRRVRNRRMRMEAQVICALSRRLTRLLREGDPIAGRVALRKPDFLAATLSALSVLL